MLENQRIYVSAIREGGCSMRILTLEGACSSGEIFFLCKDTRDELFPAAAMLKVLNHAFRTLSCLPHILT